MTPTRTPAVATPAYEPLSEAAAQQIIDTAFQLAREVGVAFDPDPAVLDRFSSAGCDISAGNVVKFERELVEACLASSARSVRLWNRAGTDYAEIRDGNTLFLPGMTNIRIFDLETGEPRESDKADLAAMTRVADALPDVDAVCMAVKDVPNSTLQGEIGEFLVLAENTGKPLMYLCENGAAFDAAIEMAAAIRGGMDRLREKPYFIQTITPLPLYYAKTHSDQIIRAAECGIPANTGTLSIGGAATPFTIAGSITHGLATDFAGVVLAQLVREGAFCAGSSECEYMEPATGGIGSRPRSILSEMAMRQVKNRLGMPPFVSAAGGCAARRFDEDAVFDIVMGMTQAFYLRPCTIDYMGELDQGMTFSPHALLLCNDLAAMLRCLWQGIRVDADQLALEVSRAVGPKGNYLAQSHTEQHCREDYWDSRYFGPRLPLSNSMLPDRNLMQRIDADLREILAVHEPEPLAEPLRAQLVAILEKY
ncbi:MAG TPA: trimethylamine methyltransferase family protein [Myxococcota bacterium]